MIEQKITKNKKISQSMYETRQKRKSQQCFVYTIKIKQNALSTKQKEQLKMLFVESKWLYNDILNYSENYDIRLYDTKTKTVNVKNKDGAFENRKLNYISGQMKQSVLTNIFDGIKGLSVLKKHGHKIGKLKFKSDYYSINLKQYGQTFKILNSKYIKIEKIKGNIKVNGLNQFYNDKDFEIANAKLLNKSDGYYLAITVYKNKDSINQNKFIGKEIGIDMGIETNITLSNGEKFNSTVEETEHLKRLQRKLSRQIKGSNNYRKTLNLLNKEYQYISNVKNDKANKLVHYILSYETIYMQDEMISNWHKGLFGKQVQHSILGRVKSKLINHPRVEVLDKSVPTTQYCSVCGNKTKHSLDKRTYHCDYCDFEMDRDVHAANNMIIMTKIIKNNLVGMERIDFKPVETLTSGISNIDIKLESMNQEADSL